MKLHRLALTNYRGIAHRDVEFPDHGVVVVCGANEIGKSSMVEALDLLLEYKDRSTKKEVKQVKPTNADVGSEVIAEISSGPYRFVYRKRFHKRCETELTVLAPRREQLTGDEAHERVRTMLAETVDTELWHAQRCCRPPRRPRWICLAATRSRVRSISPPVMTPRCRAPSRCSSSGSRPSMRATSPRPGAPPENGPRRSLGWRPPRPRWPTARRR